MTGQHPADGDPFDPAQFFDLYRAGHRVLIGTEYLAHGDDWVDLTLPYDERLIGDVETGVMASGPILATSSAVWRKARRFVAHATLDLRIDYLRPAVPGRAVIGRGECYRITSSIAFVRGQAHDGDPSDPLAHVAGTFMAPEGYR
jgi:acyl-coenzyme A thioesterase PaaI-like protein